MGRCSPPSSALRAPRAVVCGYALSRDSWMGLAVHAFVVRPPEQTSAWPCHLVCASQSLEGLSLCHALVPPCPPRHLVQPRLGRLQLRSRLCPFAVLGGSSLL